MTFETDWWWSYQDQINKQFLFSRIREDVAACLVSRLKFTNNSIKSSFENKDLVIVGAALTESTIIPPKGKEFKTTFDYKNKFRANFITTEPPKLSSVV